MQILSRYFSRKSSDRLCPVAAFDSELGTLFHESLILPSYQVAFETLLET